MKLSHLLFTITFCFFTFSSFSQEWLNDLSPEEQENCRANFELESEAFYDFWLNDGGQIRHKNGEKIEGYNQFRRKEIRFNRDGDWAGRELEIMNSLNVFRRQVSNDRSNACFYSDTFSYNFPWIIRNNGSGLIKTTFFNENDQSIWAGGSPGGLHKSSDFGQNWVDMGKNLPDFNINLIKVNPFDNNYIVVDEHYSEDNGGSWTNIATDIVGAVSGSVTAFTFFGDQEDKVIFSGTFDGDNKTFLSTDGLSSITEINNVLFTDIFFKPASTNIIYAVGGATNLYQFVYKSVDGGLSWTQTSSPPGRLLIAVSSDDPNCIYSADYGSNPATIYKSYDEANNWVAINSGVIPTANVYHNRAFGVSDVDTSRLFFGTQYSYLSLNGGYDFYQYSGSNWCGQADHVESRGLHVDSQDCVQIPGTDSVIISNDGGIFIHDFSTDSIFQTFSTFSCYSTGPKIIGSYYDKTERMNIGEVWGFDFETETANQGIVGLWHNGTAFSVEDTLFFKGNSDGFKCWSNPLDNNEFYYSWQSGYIRRGTKNPNISQTISSSGIFQTNFILDQKDPSILFHLNHTSGLRRSNDKGDNWTLIDASYPVDLDIHPEQNNHVYITKFDPGFSYSVDSGFVWTDVNLGFIPRYIRVDRNDPERVYVATIDNIYRTDDFGTLVTDISYNLPNVGFQTMTIDDDNGLYVATTGAIFYLAEGATEWVELGGNLPFIPINIIKIDNARKKLYVATDGRGVWNIKLPTYVQQLTDTLMLCPDETIEVNGILYNTLGTYNDTVQGLNACDSIYQNLTFIDGTGNVNCGSTSNLDQSPNSDFKLYPNPVEYILYLDGQDTYSDYTISNGLGQIVLSGSFVNNTLSPIEVYRLRSGIYFLNLQSEGSDEIKSLRFIKE
jgi:hypothetical protein